MTPARQKLPFRSFRNSQEVFTSQIPLVWLDWRLWTTLGVYPIFITISKSQVIASSDSFHPGKVGPPTPIPCVKRVNFTALGSTRSACGKLYSLSCGKRPLPLRTWFQASPTHRIACVFESLSKQSESIWFHSTSGTFSFDLWVIECLMTLWQLQCFRILPHPLALLHQPVSVGPANLQFSCWNHGWHHVS